MARQKRGLASESIFNRLSNVIQGLFALIREKETYVAIIRWCFWRMTPKRRRILKLIQELNPLAENAPPEMQALREEVFSKCCLEVKLQKDQEVLLNILNTVENPIGYEQIFFTALYPILIKRDMGANPIPTEQHHRLEVEIGYLAHNEDYFFWVFEIDGQRKMSLNTELDVREDLREDKRFVIYTLGCQGMVETDFAAYAEQWLLNAPRLSIALPMLATAYAEQWILNTRMYFAHILNDLKQRNYKVTAEAIPDFERARLSILRRLSLIRLERRQFQSSRRNR